MDDSVLVNEVLELTLACQQDNATPEQRARLERLLADYPQSIAWYLRIVEDTLTLIDSVAANEAGTQSAEARASLLGAISEPAIEWRNRSWPARSSRWLAAIATIACLVLVVIGVSRSSWSPHNDIDKDKAKPAKRSVDWAQVVAMSNVAWVAGAKQYHEWSLVKPGDRLRIDSGLLNLYVANGAELLIEGPADVEFVSLNNVLARQGKLAARVGPAATGFRIETPHAKLIDRGTSFGVSIGDDDRTDVVVYEGIVDLDVVNGAKQPRRRLETGEALSVSLAGKLSRITTVQNDDFLAPPRLRQPSRSTTPVIAAVHDNIRSLETTKYYRIAPGGFQEDCPAYVDRQHQWNGVDKSGLPPFLIGGDYVMTFNDDKITAEIQIAVTLAQPASLFVLIDHRVPPPEWLKRDFVDTKWSIGSDEGYEDKQIETGLGPGQSIDRVFSVWRRDVTEPGSVVLGPLSREKSTVPANKVERSMYGIVAVPLRRTVTKGAEQN